MPTYNFTCENNHTRELKMTFAEHKALKEDEKGPYTECNVRYGDLKHPVCDKKAYQVFADSSFAVYYGEEGR